MMVVKSFLIFAISIFFSSVLTHPSSPDIPPLKANRQAIIISPGGTFTATIKEDVTLPCQAVGIPPPRIVWKTKDADITFNERIIQKPDGSLFIRDLSRADTGEYSCHVVNEFGRDDIKHQLIVKAPPYPPQVTLTASTTSSLTIRLKPHENERESIEGYTILHKSEFDNWNSTKVGPKIVNYTLEDLLCGTRYELYVLAHNSFGTSDPTERFNFRTKGNKPKPPSADKFLESSPNGVILHLNAWSDEGCRMSYFVIEYKKKNSEEWTLVAANIKPKESNFVLSGLETGTWYQLRVTAHNRAGFSIREYEIAT